MAGHSTYALGLAFETHALRFLNSDLRMALSHVGGRADGGVDLRGYWWLPKPKAQKRSALMPSYDDLGAAPRATRPVKAPGLLKDGSPGRRISPLRVLGQCKAERKPQGARVVREMEGVLTHMAHETPTLGVIVSQSGFSALAMEHAQRCVHPLLLLYLEGGTPDEMEEDLDHDAWACEGPPQTIVNGAWWNARFGSMLSSRGVEARRELGRDGARLGIWYAGNRMGRYGPKS